MKLKPCPFCGGKAELYESEAYNLKTEEKEEQIRFFVMCEECTALVCGLSKKVAAERWNRRASDDSTRKRPHPKCDPAYTDRR